MIGINHEIQPSAQSHTAKLRANVARRNIDRSYVVRRAMDTQTLHDAYELRHSSYLATGYIDPRPGGVFCDKYDALPTSHTIVVYDETTAVASVRVCFLSADNLATAPAGEAYPEEVGAMLARLPRDGSRAQALEITRLVRHPAAENNQGLVFLLLRLAGYFAISEGVQAMLSCVRVNHIPLYRRMGNEVVGPLRPYPGLKFSTQLLACTRARYDEARAAFPIMDPMTASPEFIEDFTAGRPAATPLTFPSTNP